MINPIKHFLFCYGAWKDVFEDSPFSIELIRAYFFATLNQNPVEIRDALIKEIRTTTNFRLYNPLSKLVLKINSQLHELSEFKEYLRQCESLQDEKQILEEKRFSVGLNKKEESRFRQLNTLIDELMIKRYGF